MKKTRMILPLLALVLAVTTAFAVRTQQYQSDKVWFQTDANGDPINVNDGRRGEASPFSCSDGTVVCARSLSLAAGETSLNAGSTTMYHINAGYNLQDDYDAEERKP